MNEKLTLYAKKFEAFSIRERLMIIVAIVAIAYMAFDFVLLEPLKAEKSVAVESIKKWKLQIGDINQQVQAITATLNDVKSSNVDNEVVALKNKIDESNARMETLIYSFVRPRQMAEVLRNLLQQEQGLTLMRLQSQQVQPLLSYDSPLFTEAGLGKQSTQVKQLLASYRDQLSNEQKASMGVAGNLANIPIENKENNIARESADIFRHGIEIEFYGDFNSTVSYLKAVEALPWRFYWDEVNYTVEEYPQALVKVVIYTLSLDRGWIDV